jgi:hypothetical protein
MTVANKMLEITAETAAPMTPSLGAPKAPVISRPDSGTWTKALKIIIAAGKRIFPMPRKIALTTPTNQTKMPPKNST